MSDDSATTLNKIREQIAAILGAVEGMGVVHQYQRWSKDYSKFLDFFTVTDADEVKRVNGCIITRKSTVSKADGFGKDEDMHTFLIRFYRGLKDDQATELTFQAILEEARDAFRANETLNDTCDTVFPVEGKAGLQIDNVDIRIFGSVLCHFGECTLTVLVRVDV